MGRMRVGQPIARNSAIWITDFGAVGNGSTDCTTAITNAIAASASSFPNCPPIFIPPGTYAHNATLNVDSLCIYGAGDISVLKPTTPAQTSLFLTGTNPVAFNFKKNITSPGPRLGPDETHGISSHDFTNLTVINIHVVNSAAAGIFLRDGQTAKIWNNMVEFTNADGIITAAAVTSPVTSDIDVQFNYIHAAGDDGLSTNAYDTTTIIRWNASNNTVIGNTTSRNVGLDGGSTLTVTGNHFEDGTAVGASGVLGFPTPCPDHVTISGNTIKNSIVSGGAPPWGNVTGGAINLYNDRTDIPQTMTNVTISGNQIINAGSNMCVVNGSGNYASSVSIINNDYYGPSVPLVTHTGTGTTSAVTTGNVNHGTSIPADLVPILGGIDSAWRLNYRMGSAWNQGFIVKWS